VDIWLQREIRGELRDWRSHMANRSELSEPFDAERDHFRGHAAAPVVVVEYGELGSPAESREDRALRNKLRSMLDDGRICLAFRHFPIIDSHPGAWLAAQGVEAADLQGRFWDLHAALTDIETSPWATELNTRTILTIARRLKLDVVRLEADMGAPWIATRILRDLHSGFRSGVNGVPTYYVQGIRQLVEGPDELLERIEHALAGDFGALWPPVHKHAYQRRALLTSKRGTGLPSGAR
jgi:protein-disulfide isomerase